MKKPDGMPEVAVYLLNAFTCPYCGGQSVIEYACWGVTICDVCGREVWCR